MGITIREADLVRDKPLLIKTLNQNRRRKSDEQRYRWLYLDNPVGRAKAWLAINDQNGDIAGFTSVFPRVMHVSGKEIVCWTCGDFSINKRYRTLGVAIQLRLAATTRVNQGEVGFLYAHPNDRMRVVHIRAGHKVIGNMVRYSRPVRVDRYLPRFMSGSRLSDGLGWSYNSIASIRNRSGSLKRSFRTEIHNRIPKDAPFDSLLNRVYGRFRVFGLRNFEFLNWRYGSNPLMPMHTLLLYRDGDLVGYAVYSIRDEAMYVCDLFCVPDQEPADALIAHLTAVGFDQKVQAVSVTLLESNPVIRSLKRNGYFLRPETSSVIIHTAPECPWGPVVEDKRNWFMTVGDRDV